MKAKAKIDIVGAPVVAAAPATPAAAMPAASH
jgi:hypothetical protein